MADGAACAKPGRRRLIRGVGPGARPGHPGSGAKKGNAWQSLPQREFIAAVQL